MASRSAHNDLISVCPDLRRVVHGELRFHVFREADGFAEWFAAVSPLEEIGGLRIGSRPAAVVTGPISLSGSAQ